MKKLAATLFALSTILILMLTGCSSNESVYECINAIDSIGAITIDSEEVISEAELMYRALTIKQRAKINNYQVLILARAKYDDIVAEQAAKDAAIAAEQDERETKARRLAALKNKLSEFVDLHQIGKVSSDGMSLEVNTTEKEAWHGESFHKITWINMGLGLPDSLADKMAQTRALDGRQTYDSGDISVSWSYHPNTGMNVIYEIIP